jgi:polysaccharide biosynthesis transport protein
VRTAAAPRVIVLTSSSPAEGKTTVATNLAIALAEIRQRVLLIDADLRKPRIHDIFQVDNGRGLSDILRERDPI